MSFRGFRGLGHTQARTRYDPYPKGDPPQRWSSRLQGIVILRCRIEETSCRLRQKPQLTLNSTFCTRLSGVKAGLLGLRAVHPGLISGGILDHPWSRQRSEEISNSSAWPRRAVVVTVWPKARTKECSQHRSVCLLSQAAKAKATALSKIGSTSLRHARSSLCPVLALGRGCRPVYQ